jgi:hypothetical protein
MIEFGGRYDGERNAIFRPYVAVGASFQPDNQRAIDAGFVGAPAGTFETVIRSPGVLGNLAVGVQF